MMQIPASPVAVGLMHGSRNTREDELVSRAAQTTQVPRRVLEPSLMNRTFCHPVVHVH